jgi:hypothetical protein
MTEPIIGNKKLTDKEIVEVLKNKFPNIKEAKAAAKILKNITKKL